MIVLLTGLDPNIFGSATEYQANAAYIDLLHKVQNQLNKRLATLGGEIEHLHSYYRYMQRFIDILKKHPVLLDEWIGFLATIDMQEPEWKHEYAID